MGSFKQGEDYKLSVKVTETPAIDFTTATDIHAILFVGDKQQAKYSLNAKTGYGVLEVDTVTDTVDVFVERIESLGFDVGQLSVNIQAVFPDVTFPDGNKVREFDVNNVARVMIGRALDNQIP